MTANHHGRIIRIPTLNLIRNEVALFTFFSKKWTLISGQADKKKSAHKCLQFFTTRGRALQSPRPTLISLDSLLWEVFDVAAIHCLICLDLDREPSDSSITIRESNAIALEGLGGASQC